MARGPKRHLKRFGAPKNWMSDKLGGVFASRPMCGPHKLRESLPLILFLRSHLKYALSYNKARMICKQRAIKVDGKVRTEFRFPAGFNLLSNVFVIGKGSAPLLSLPADKRIKLSIAEERDKRLAQKSKGLRIRR